MDGQGRIGAAVVAVVGDGLAAETSARYLAAAGVGTLRLIARLPPTDVVAGALRGSNPDLVLQHRPPPDDQDALAGCAAVVRFRVAARAAPELAVAGALAAARALRVLAQPSPEEDGGRARCLVVEPPDEPTFA